MAVNPEVGSTATTPEPAGATQPTGERDMGFFDDLPGQEEPQVQAQPKEQTSDPAPYEYHPKLENLSKLRVTDPESKKALQEHLLGWDKELRRQDTEREAFESEQSLIKGLAQEIANANDPAKAMKALQDAVGILEQAHGYKLNFGAPAQAPAPVEIAVPKKYENPADQAYFEDTVKESVGLATQAASAELAKVRQEIAQLRSGMGVVEEIAQERTQQKEQRQLAERIRADTPEAIEKVKSQTSGWSPTPEQSMQAGTKYGAQIMSGAMDLEGAIFLTFKKEYLGHVSEQANRGGARQEQIPAGAGNTARPVEDMTRFNVGQELAEIAAKQ